MGRKKLIPTQLFSTAATSDFPPLALSSCSSSIIFEFQMVSVGSLAIVYLHFPHFCYWICVPLSSPRLYHYIHQINPQLMRKNGPLRIVFYRGDFFRWFRKNNFFASFKWQYQLCVHGFRLAKRLRMNEWIYICRFMSQEWIARLSITGLNNKIY